MTMIKQAVKSYSDSLDSNRFLIVQQGIIIAVLAAVAKTLWAAFPILELYGFLSPVVLGVYALKTWGHTKGEADGKNNRVLTQQSSGSVDRGIPYYPDILTPPVVSDKKT